MWVESSHVRQYQGIIDYSGTETFAQESKSAKFFFAGVSVPPRLVATKTIAGFFSDVDSAQLAVF